jgi:tRNA dimethylallyltransferase
MPISAHQRAHDYRQAPLRHPARVIGLAPLRVDLHVRIDRRVDDMIAAGWLDEVRALGTSHGLDAPAFDAIGYRELAAHLRGELPLAEAIAAIKSATRRYARRQLSWFRAEPDVTWFEAGDDVRLAPPVV